MRIDPDELRGTLEGAYQGEMAFNAPMGRHTSLGIGGPADLLVVPSDPLSLRNLVVLLAAKGIPHLTVGGGTNLLVRDSGIEGAVILMKSFGRIEVLKETEDRAELFVEAGAPLQRLVNFCREKGYSGIEGLTGIPGTAGGAISGNAGAFGYEMKDIIESVAIMDSRGKLERFRPEGLEFGYRRSAIQAGEAVLSANIKLKKEEREKVSERTGAFFAEKKKRQPISERSAGCVFKNPEGERAGRLIEEAGCKGMKIGGVEVSPLHANFFVNGGGGTASDFLNLIEKVTERVREKFGITLEKEIRIMGKN